MKMQRKNLNRLFMLLLFAAFNLAAQVQEETETLSNYSLGVEAYKEGEFRLAFEAWSLGAYEGNAEAQYNLGVLYLEGRGVEANAEQARDWFMKAAEKNHVEAQYNLGHMSLSGMGMEKNVKAALQWWKLAAEGGYAQAQFNYGRALYLGIEEYDDKAGGLLLIRLAAEQKDKRAQDFLNSNEKEIALLNLDQAADTSVTANTDNPVLKKLPARGSLPESEPGEIKLQIVRDQPSVQKNYLIRSSDVPVIVYMEADLRVPMAQLKSRALLKVTAIDANKVRIKPASGMPTVWVERRQLDFDTKQPGLTKGEMELFAQPDGDRIGLLPAGTRITALTQSDAWVELRLSDLESGWIAARNLAYSGESAQQLRDAWITERGAVKIAENRSAESGKLELLVAKKTAPTAPPESLEIMVSNSNEDVKESATAENSLESRVSEENPHQSSMSINDNAWLFTQGKGAHVIHLFTLLDIDKALRISKQAPYRDRAHLYTTRAKQKQWAFLLLGPYVDESAAKSARIALPAHYAKSAQVRQLSLIAKNRCAKRDNLNADQSRGLDAFCF